MGFSPLLKLSMLTQRNNFKPAKLDQFNSVKFYVTVIKLSRLDIGWAKTLYIALSANKELNNTGLLVFI